MIKKPEDFFTDLKEWSIRKLNIISNYTDGFSRILGSKNDILYYIDGFAGQGIYDDGEKGSPVRMAEFSESLRNKNEKYSLVCINIEKDPEIYKNLKKATAKFGENVINLEGSFIDKCDEVLSIIKDKPAIFFIDPFGVKGPDWTTIEKILSRKDFTDIWLRYDHITIQRLCGFFASDANSAEGKLKTLQGLFGIKDSIYLMSRLKCGDSPEERIANSLSLYIECLETAQRKLGRNGFAAAYPIRSINGGIKYHLILSCSHSKAATLASDIVNLIEETFEREKEEYKESQTGQLSFFHEVTQQDVFSSKVKNLKELILLLPKNTITTRQKLHYELLIQNKNLFGKFRGKHLNKAIRELLSDNPPRISCAGAPSQDNSKIVIE